jgi:hypothetical protein
VSDLGVTWCPECRAPVVDLPERWEAHRQRVHSVKRRLERLPDTRELVRGSGRGRISEEDSILCSACRSGNHLACDGYGCRCVCSLELDEKRPHVRRGWSDEIVVLRMRKGC